MSNVSSCISWPPATAFVVLRQPALDICEQDTCSAILLHFFTRWHDTKLASNPGKLIQRHKVENISKGILFMFKKERIKKSIDFLVSAGFLLRLASGQDRTGRYLFQPDAVNHALSQKTKSGFEKTKSDFEKTKSDFALYDHDSDQDLITEVEEEPTPTPGQASATTDQQAVQFDASIPLPKNISFLEQPNDWKKEPEIFTQQGYGNDLISDKEKVQGDCAQHRKTSKLIYGGGNMSGLAKLVAVGEANNLWQSQAALVAFQQALMIELGQLGRSSPAVALKAIFKGVQNQEAAELEEVTKYWGRFDGTAIKPDVNRELPWVGGDGLIIPAYESWVRANHTSLDGQLADGTYKINLILQIKSSNKIAAAAWESYQQKLAADARASRPETEDLEYQQLMAVHEVVAPIVADESKLAEMREKMAQAQEAKRGKKPS